MVPPGCDCRGGHRSAERRACDDGAPFASALTFGWRAVCGGGDAGDSAPASTPRGWGGPLWAAPVSARRPAALRRCGRCRGRRGGRCGSGRDGAVSAQRKLARRNRRRDPGGRAEARRQRQAARGAAPVGLDPSPAHPTSAAAEGPCGARGGLATALVGSGWVTAGEISP